MNNKGTGYDATECVAQAVKMCEEMYKCSHQVFFACASQFAGAYRFNAELEAEMFKSVQDGLKELSDYVPQPPVVSFANWFFVASPERIEERLKTVARRLELVDANVRKSSDKQGKGSGTLKRVA